MATISVPSSIQGKTYSVKIAGDTPTPEEQARISAFVAQQDAQLSKFMPGAQKEAAPEEKGGIGTALGVGVDMLQQAYGSALEGAGSSLGLQSLRDYGRSVSDFNSQQIQEATPGLTGYEDVSGIGSGLKYFGETLAKQVPQLGVSLAGAGAGAAIGSAVPFIGTGIGAITGGALANIPYFYGANRERQKEADTAAGRAVEVDEGAAFLSAIPQATLDAIVDKMLVGKLLKPSMVGAGGIFTRAVKGAGTGIAVEVPTEIGQQMIERAQAGLPLDSDDAVSEYAAVARETAIVGGSVGSVANVVGGDARVQKQKEQEEEASRQMQEDQEEDAKDIMAKIGFGQKSMEAPVEQPKRLTTNLLPPPTAGTTPATAPTAPKATSGIQLDGVDDAIANGVANLRVKEDGREVPFKTFALSVDGDRAEVGFVEKQQSARKGIGRDAYVALGNDLSSRGITLQSTETLLKDGNALWKRLERSGNATYNPSTKRFEFKPNAETQAVGTTSTAAGREAPSTPSFRWKQYQSTIQNIGKAKAPTIAAIQKAAEAAGNGPVTPAVARDIRAQMERDGVVKPSAKVKGGYEYQPNVTPQVDRAESYRRTIEDVTREAQDARLAREKALQDARRAQQTGKLPDYRKFMLQVDKADQDIAAAERTVQEVSAQMPMAQQQEAVPTAQQPRSLMEGKQKFAPITEAGPAAQARAVTSRGQRLRQAMSYYQDQARRQNLELRRLQDAQKKVQLPKSDIKRMDDLKASIADATRNVQQIGQRLANPTADIEENVAQQKAAEAKQAAAQAERAAKTPIYGQKEGEIFNALRKRLNGMGLKDVQLVAEKMLKPETAKQGALYEGLFDVKDGNRLIAVSMGVYDPNMTAKEQTDALGEVVDHEVIHALKNLGLFTDAEWKTLTDLAARQQYMKAKGGKVVQRNYTYLQRAKQMYASETPEIQVEEAIAEMFRDYVAGRLKIGGRPKTLMDRIKAFFASIRKSHEDAGITDPNQIFEGVRFGQIGGRERKAENRVSPVSPNEAATERQSKREVEGGQDEQKPEDVGSRPAGSVGEGEVAGRQAGQPTSKVVAPRSDYGGTDFGGLTLEDLDTLSPEFFERPGWAILTATVQDQSQDKNDRAHQQMKDAFEYMGIPYREAYGVYQGSPDGVSYIALMDEPTALMLGARYNQDSVLTNRGLVYARAPMPRNIRQEGVAYYGDEARKQDFYSEVNGDQAFSLGLDFETSGPTVADIGPGYYTIPERPQLPIRASDGKVELHHWTKKTFKNVDPAKAGTGPLEGVERGRGAQLGFFGIMPRPDARAQGTGYVKEPGLGNKEYIALVDPKSLYPYFTDPDNLSEGLDPNDSYFQNDYEERIKEAGYKGYYTERISGQTPLGKVTPFNAEMGNVASMFYKTPVKPVQEVQLGLRNPTRYSVRRGITAPLTKTERRLTVLDRMDPTTGEFIPDGKKRDVVQALTDLFAPRSNFVIEENDENAVRQVSRLMLAELRMALIRSPEAIGWYGTTLAKAKRVAAIMHPEISPVNPYSGAKSNSYDPDAEHAWDLAMAITSNGMAVSENAKFANEQYEYWKENGFFREEGTGDQGVGMAAAFRAYNAMKRRMTDAQIAAFLSEKMSVSALKRHPVIADLGLSIGSSEAADATVNGSYIFGPKIGQGFYQNLRGNFDPLTMDLWFMRMFNRLTGRPFKQVSDELLRENGQRVVNAANDPDLSDYDRRVKRAAMAAENIDAVTIGNADRFAIAFDTIYQRDFKKFYDDAIAQSGLDPKSREAKEIGKAARPAGSELTLASKRYRENLGINPQDVPRGAGDRAFMREVVSEVRSALANEGMQISTADIQAVMWYAEKQLFAAMGVRPGKGGDNDYVDGAIELLRSKGIDDAEIARGLPAAERDRLRYRTATERAAGRVRGGADAAGAVQEGSGTGDVPEATIGGGAAQAPRNGRKGGLKERASVRYSVTPYTKAVQQKVQSNQNALMYAKSSDLIAKLLNLRGYGMEEQKAREFSDGILRRFQDSMIPIGRMVQELTQAGLTITDAMDPYLQESLMHGVVGQKVEENQKTLFKPLLDAVKGLNVPKARIDALVAASDAASAKGKGFVGLALQRYNSPRLALADALLYARHAKERNRFVEGNRDITNQSGSGMTDAEADAILNWVRGLDDVNRGLLAKIDQQARMIVENTNRTRVDAGLISPEFAGLDGETVEGANFKYYVPLRGKFGEDADDKFTGPPSNPLFGAKGREDKQMLGRFDYGTDLIANLFTQNQNAILRGERNKVGQSFLKLLRADPEMTSSYASILERVPMRRVPGKGGKLKDVPDQLAAQEPDILIVKENGKQTWVRFTDPGMAGAMNGRNGMSPSSANVMLKAMQTLNRYLSTINTSYNPEFIITNGFRDLQTGLLNMNQFELDGVVKEVMGGLKGAALGIRSVIRKDNDTSEWAKVYKDYMAAGGQNVTNQFNTLSEELGNIQSMLGDISEAGISGKWAKVKDSFVGKRVGSVIRTIEDYNTIAENTIRLSAYKALLDRGFTRQRAAQAARNLTVNFAKGGDYRQFWGAWSLFYNASLQGSFALLNAAVRSPRVRKMWLGLIIAGIAQDQLNAMFSDDDDDGEKVYDKIPDHILERNFVLPDFLNLTDRSYITIPMPYGLNMAHNLGRAASAALRGAKDPGEASYQIMMNIIDTVNPLGGTESFFNFVAPTIVDPLVDIVENEDFADKPIYKEGLPFDKTPAPSSQQYWSTTSPSAVWISNMLNEMTGGNEVRPGFIDWSPDVLEFWFDFATGGIGRFAQSSVEGPLAVMGEGLTEDTIRQVPLARKLVGSVSSREDTGAYMEGAKRVLMAAEELKRARETGDADWARETIQTYGKELRLIGPIKSIETSLRKISMQRNQITDNPNIPEDQKRLLLDRLDERKQMILSQGNRLLKSLE